MPERLAMEDRPVPGPIQPSMRKVLDEIAASKSERDAAAASEPSRRFTAGGPGRQGAVAEDEWSAAWSRLEHCLQALEREAAEQTRLLREILGRLPQRD